MIEEMSPFAQRILALGILLLGALLTLQLIVTPLLERVAVSRDALADSRYRLAKLESLDARPDMPKGQAIEPGLLILAATAQQAQNQLLGQISRIASATTVIVQKGQPQTTQTLASVAAANIELSGSEASVMLFIDQLEAARPRMRLRAWRIDIIPEKPGELRLAATVVASWEQRR